MIIKKKNIKETLKYGLTLISSLDYQSRAVAVRNFCCQKLPSNSRFNNVHFELWAIHGKERIADFDTAMFLC